MMTQRITGNLTLAFGLLSVAAGLVYARRIGIVGPDIPARGAMALSGLVVTVYGNAIPKLVTTTSAEARAIKRVAGWAFVLCGIAYAAIWAFAPMAIAADASMLAMGSAFVPVLGYALWRRSKAE